jgi:hypothetical protein
MGHPNSSLTLGIPFASADGRFYSRFPQGNRFSEAGLASGALSVAVAAAPNGFAGSGLTALELDFIARATAPGVKYATNFKDVWLNGVKNAARSGIATNQKLRDEAFEVPGDVNRVTLDTTRKLSGNGLRLETLPTTDRQEGSWAFQPNGIDGTLHSEIYLQCSIYLPRETLAYRWLDNGDAFQKFINLGQLGSGQVVIGYDRFCGFICLLLNGTGSLGGQLYSIAGGSNPWGITTTRENPALGAGTTLTSANSRQQWLNTYGPLPRALGNDPVNETNYDYSASDPYLDTRAGNLFGWPDSRVLASGAVPWQKDGWTVVEVYCKYNGPGPVSTIQLWAQPRAAGGAPLSPPVLLIDEVGTVDLGTTNTVAAGFNAWDRFELLNYATGRQPEPGRPVQYTYFDEVITAIAAINFPGGYEPPAHQGASSAPNYAQSMVAGTWYDISGTTPDLSLASTNIPNNVDPDPARSKPYSGGIGFRGIMDAWSSSVYCPTLGAYGSQLFYGGGHSDYWGNGILRFDIATRTWSMLTQPSEAGPFSGTLTNGAYIDGTPSPPHTYQYEQYDPVSKSLVTIKAIDHVGASQSEPISTWALPWMFSTETLTWRRGPLNSNTSSPSDGLMCYDSARLGFWHCNHTNGVFTLYSPAGDNGNGTFGTWSAIADSPDVYNSGSAMAHDPVTDRILVMDFTAGALWRKSPASMVTARVAVSQTGKPTTVKYSSWEWSSALGGFICMIAGTGNVYVVRSADAWATSTWTLLTTNTNGKTFTAATGIFNRVRVCEYGTTVLLVFGLSTATAARAIRLQ